MAYYLTWRDADGNPQREEANSAEDADIRDRLLRELYDAEDVEVRNAESDA